MKKIIVMLAIVKALYSCQKTSNELPDTERDKIKEEIKTITNSIYESENRKDFVQLFSHFSDKTTGIISGTIMDSWEGHKKYGTEFLASQKELEAKIETMTVDVLSRDVAVLYGKYSMTVTDTTGTSINTNPAWTYVFTKENGQWKGIHFHVSDPPKK